MKLWMTLFIIFNTSAALSGDCCLNIFVFHFLLTFLMKHFTKYIYFLINHLNLSYISNFLLNFYKYLLASFKFYFKEITTSLYQLTANNLKFPPKLDAYLFFKNFHIYIYLCLIIATMISCVYWHFCFLLFLTCELIILFFSPIKLFKDIWVVRLPLISFFFCSIETNFSSKFVDYVIIKNFKRLTFDTISDDFLVSLNNSFVDIDTFAYFLISYFFALYLPQFLQCSIIFLPFLSAISLFLFGYLIGYSIAGQFAAGCIIFTSLASFYLWFLYSPALVNFTNIFGLSGPCSTLEFSESFFYPGTINIKLVDKLLYDSINLYSCEEYNSSRECSNLFLEIYFGNFINAAFINADFEFIIDSVTIVMLFVITTISALVHAYSTVYMCRDPHQVRFFAFLSLFTFFMIILVQAENLIILYIGWEGVGLSSYLLIAFWFTRTSAVKAATKAIIINKIGDLFLVLAVALIVYVSNGVSSLYLIPEFFGSFSYQDKIFGIFSLLDVVAISIVLAALVKSAQVFFHTWLADAMEGPTPVSALLHAATMVTAGVYLVVRFSHIIEFSYYAKLLMFFAGFFTIIFSSCVAAAQYDIKKIIAYSTCSQIGLMFFSCGLSAYNYALFHFFNHAFFKCLLFLLAGAIIHELNNEQDIRKMGGLASKMPATFVFFLISILSLVGTPGFSGAVSKDLIINLVNFIALDCDNTYPIRLFMFSTNIIIFLTAIYAFRLLYYVFLKTPCYRFKSFNKLYSDVSTSNPVYNFVFSFLAVFSICGGYFFKNHFLCSKNYFVSVFSVLGGENHYYAMVCQSSYSSWIAFFLTVFALVIAVFFIQYVLFLNENSIVFWSLQHNRFFYNIFCFFNKKCYFDEFYINFFIRPLFQLSHIFNWVIEPMLFNFSIFLCWKVLLLLKRVRRNFDFFTIYDHLHHSCLFLLLLFLLSRSLV